MLAAGAHGATEQQLIDALRVPLPATQLHAAIGGLVRALAQRSGPGVTLAEVDQAWVQQKLHLLPGFTTILTRAYGAPLASIDFTNTQRAADTINAWVSDKTHAKIPKLVSADLLDSAELVLTDAVYLDAKWEHGFDKAHTTDESFHLAGGSTASVPTMHQTEHLSVATGSGWTAVALPYKGGKLEMDVVVPDDLAQFERGLDGTRLDAILAGMKPAEVALALPKFEFRRHFDNLRPALGALGVRDAFDPARADFSAMTSDTQLYLAAVVHEAFVHVDEQGTIAAGATGGILVPTSAEVVVPVRVDKPFLFAVRDRATGAIVFLGRVTDPRSH
jgi:serpin B